MGDAEVGDEGRAVGGEEQVLGLDVAVHHAVPVGVLQGARRLGRDPERRVHRQLPLAPQTVAERLSLHEGHGEPELSRRLARVVDGEDVGMLEPGGEPDLPLEALGAERGGEIGMEDLERHGPVVPEVVGEEDGGHPTAAELTLEAVG